jgi:hypothetical protein
MNHRLLTVVIAWIACTTRAAESAAVAIAPETYLGKPVAKLTFQDFKILPVERRNSVVAEIVRAKPLQRPELDLLRMLASEKLLTEPSVLGPLIEALERAAPKADQDYSQQRANDISMALQSLRLLTRRDSGRGVESQRQRQPDKVREVAAWWSEWWAKNHDRHPMVDATLEQTITRRVAAIESRLMADLGGDYYELRYLKPKEVRVSYIEPLVDIQIDSTLLAEGFTRRGADGKEHLVKDEERTYTRIQVTFKMEKLPGDLVVLGQEPPKSFAPFLERLFSEDIPGTDLITTIDVGQQKGDFVRRARESLSKLRSSSVRK